MEGKARVGAHADLGGKQAGAASTNQRDAHRGRGDKVDRSLACNDYGRVWISKVVAWHPEKIAADGRRPVVILVSKFNGECGECWASWRVLVDVEYHDGRFRQSIYGHGAKNVGITTGSCNGFVD
jgi:hypothetical protein